MCNRHILLMSYIFLPLSTVVAESKVFTGVCLYVQEGLGISGTRQVPSGWGVSWYHVPSGRRFTRGGGGGGGGHSTPVIISHENIKIWKLKKTEDSTQN